MAVLRTMCRRGVGVVLGALLIASTASAARLKDIAEVEGVRGNQLYGYGIVVGLNGTGDGNSVDFTTQSLSNLMERLGIKGRRVKEEDDFNDLAGLIIPGGESTCLKRLLDIFRLKDVIRRHFQRGMKIWGVKIS